MPLIIGLAILFAGILLIAAMALLLRDLFSRNAVNQQVAKMQVDIASLVPSGKDEGEEGESWFGQLVEETGSGFTPDTAFLLAVVLGVLVGGALFVWRDDPLAGAAGAVAGVLATGGLLYFLRARRYNAIRDVLPDVMELMARAVRAGESLDQAIALVGESAFRPLAGEFHYCSSQMKMGLSLETAIRRLASRVPLTETRILAMTLIVQRRRGGNLPVTLERLAKVVRDRANYFRQFRAATAAGRGSAFLIGVVALILDAVVLVWHPQHTEVLLTDYYGRILFTASIVLQIIGILTVVGLFRSQK